MDQEHLITVLLAINFFDNDFFPVSVNLMPFCYNFIRSLYMWKSTAKSCCIADVHDYISLCFLFAASKVPKGNVSSIYRMRFSFKAAVSKVMKEVIPLVSTVPCVLHLLIQSILPLRTLSSGNL